jgi:hypothetical protein
MTIPALPTPRVIPDEWIVFFGPYEGKTYAEVKVLDASYAEGLRYILGPSSCDKYFLV